MAFRKHVMISIVLLSVSGLLLGCGDDNSVTPTTTPDEEAPLIAPTNVTAAVLANGTIELTWSSNSQPTLKGYNVYRLDATAGAVGKINPDLLTVNHYVDTDIPHGNYRYEYWVTAVSVKGIETAPSAAVELTTYPNGGKGRDKDLP